MNDEGGSYRVFLGGFRGKSRKQANNKRRRTLSGRARHCFLKRENSFFCERSEARLEAREEQAERSIFSKKVTLYANEYSNLEDSADKDYLLAASLVPYFVKNLKESRDV